MKKVLVYKSDLLPLSETFIKEQVLACASWTPVLVGQRRVGGLDLGSLPVRILQGQGLARLRGLGWKVLRELNLTPPGVVGQMKRENADLVHVHFGTEAVKLWPALQRLGLPVLVTLHGSDINIYREWWERPGAGVASRHYPGRLLEMGRHPLVHFVAVGEAIRQRAIAYGLPAEKITVRRIGIAVDKFRPTAQAPSARAARILYVGRMVEKKGGHYLLEAFAKVRAALPQAELLMVGDGPMLAELKARAAALNVPVDFPGSLPPLAVRDAFDGARVFCSPSVVAENGDAEGLPTVIVEAQASGVPVVTCARGGTDEGIADGITGIAFAEKDTDALAKALIRVLSEPGLCDQMGARAAERARQMFDIRHCTAALEDLYDEVSARHRGKVPAATTAWQASHG